MSGIIKGYDNINVGCSHEEMIPNWLGITIWGGNYDGLSEDEIQDGIQIYKHDDAGGHVINHNVNKGLPFRDNSISNIYSSHFIEHLTYTEAKDFLKESFRVLRPNHTIRIVCPDISIWIEKLYKNKDKKFFSEYKKMLDIDYWENYIFSEHHNIKTNTQIFNSMIFNWGHKWMWDYESLKLELNKIGFKNIEKKSFLNGKLDELEHIENRLSQDKIETRNLESIFIEATKPKDDRIL